MLRKVIFGSACLVGGLLLVLIMLFIGANPNAFGSLNLLGKLFVWGGILVAVAGALICITHLGDGE